MVYLANLIKRSVTGPTWHGPALDQVLDGVTVAQAAEHPIRGAHSIWELVLHVASWAEIARDRLRGERIADPPAEQDWPSVGDTTEARWGEAVDRLRTAYRALAADVRQLDETLLHETMHGLGYSRWTMLHGVVEHGLYHAGQVALLKKM